MRFIALTSVLPGRWLSYARLIRLDKPIGTVLLAWPAMWALWLAAGGVPLWSDLCIVLACAFLTRSAGCALNDWADRSIDGSVQRTRMRPLATGALMPSEALALAAVFLLGALILSWFLSYSVWWLLPPVLALIVCYPFTKRFFVLPQLVLALTFSMAVPIAWYAVAGQFDTGCWLLMVVTAIWVFAYDTTYAMSDVRDDSLIGVHSSALFFGAHAQAAVALLHTLMLAGLWLLGAVFELNLHWYLTMLVVLASMGWQHFLISRASRDDFIRSFRHNGWLGLIIWAGLALQWL